MSHQTVIEGIMALLDEKASNSNHRETVMSLCHILVELAQNDAEAELIAQKFSAMQLEFDERGDMFMALAMGGHRNQVKVSDSEMDPIKVILDELDKLTARINDGERTIEVITAHLRIQLLASTFYLTNEHLHRFVEILNLTTTKLQKA